MLKNLGILTTLAAFDLAVVGTIPLEIDLLSSDIDIICEVALAVSQTFAQLLHCHYSHLPAFRLGHVLSGSEPALVSSFRYAHVELEIFG